MTNHSYQFRRPLNIYTINYSINLTLFHMLWIFSLYNKQLFWFGIIILRILFESATHKNISLPLQVMLNIYPCTKQVIMFFMFSTIKAFAVSTKNCGPDIADIGSKEDARHGGDIIARDMLQGIYEQQN